MEQISGKLGVEADFTLNRESWEPLGFHFPPFDNTRLRNQMLFRSSALSFLRERFVVLDESPVSLCLVLGARGMGKTTAAHMLFRMKTKIATHFVVGSPGTSLINLMKSVSIAVGVKLSTVGGDADALLASLLHKVQSSGMRMRVLIDEAHLLPAETLEALVRMCEMQPAGSVFQFVLFGRQVLRDRVNAVRKQKGLDFAMRAWFLQPLSRLETFRYITFRLVKASLDTKYVVAVSDEVLARIYECSAGVPFDVNSYASELLLPVYASKQEMVRGRKYQDRQEGDFFSRFKFMFVVVFFVLTAMSCMLYWAASEEGLVAVATEPPGKVDVNDLYTKRMLMPNVSNDSNMVMLHAKLPEAIKTAASKNTVGHHNLEHVSAIKSQAKTLEPPDYTVSKAFYNQFFHGVVAGVFHGRMQADMHRLLGFEEGAVLQLGAFNDVSRASQLLALARKLNVEVYLYNFYRSGQPYYGVVTGRYSEMGLARAGIGSMPEELRNLKPWARTIASVKQEINS